MTKLALAALALAACTMDVGPAPELGAGDLRNRDVTLDDDGTQVAITGCLSGIVGPCQVEDGDTMTVTADGTTYGVPPATIPPDPTVIGDTGEVEFRGTVPAPTDLTVEVVLAGDTGRIELPPAFSVTPPPGSISRSAGSLVLSFAPLPGARASADETITCGSDHYELDGLAVTTPGQLELMLDNYLLTGTCTHDVEIHQTLAVPSSQGVSGWSVRTATLAFTSMP